MHDVHVDAPAEASGFVCEPAAHTAQATVASAVKVPAAHCVQVVAPLATSVSVVAPSIQVLQLVADGAATVAEYFPAGHCVHSDLAVSLYCPGWQSWHSSVDTFVPLPARHAVHRVAPLALSVFV